MSRYLISYLCFLIFLSSCTKDKAPQDTGGFPKEVGNIIINKCSVTGCHTDNSKEAAGGLSLTSWDKLFEGGHGGSVVIPYRHDQSWLSYFVNTYSDLGIKLTPTMPNNNSPLSRTEVLLLQKWIDNGAPGEKGDIAFSGDPLRNKFYVANQGCNEVTVFDTKTLLAMRYIKVGDANNTIPHEIKVSPDGQYWYVVFLNGNLIQKYRTTDDSYIGSINIGQGLWGTLAFSHDGTKAFVVDFDNEGKVAFVDLDAMKLITTYQGNGLFVFSHGVDVSADLKTLYVTAEYGNVYYKIDITDPFAPNIQTLVLEPGQQPTTNTSAVTMDPHQIAISPDGTKYFVTCMHSNEIRVFQTSNDSLIKVIPVGDECEEMSFSHTQPYLFISCEEDPCSQPNCDGSVYVLNYNDLTVVKKLQEQLYQPHGIAVDDKNGIVMVASRNVNPNGPAPHHSSVCGGRNGFVRIIDLNTLTFKEGYRTEVSVDPYFVTVRN